uniref:Uncharacterized protein n=1 Tax=Romanomermis culicivorax TaxID=13658 RepID=A0A915JRY5_ROMCU
MACGGGLDAALVARLLISVGNYSAGESFHSRSNVTELAVREDNCEFAVVDKLSEGQRKKTDKTPERNLPAIWSDEQRVELKRSWRPAATARRLPRPKEVPAAYATSEKNARRCKKRQQGAVALRRRTAVRLSGETGVVCLREMLD